MERDRGEGMHGGGASRSIIGHVFAEEREGWNYDWDINTNTYVCCDESVYPPHLSYKEVKIVMWKKL